MNVGPELKVGGTLGPADLYIERSEDTATYDLLAAGEFCNILTSRQMGKSSLMVRLMSRLTSERGARIASVDLAGDLGTPEDVDRWYIGFFEKLALDLDLDCEIEPWWRDSGRGTANSRMLQFFREVVGTEIKEPVYVFVDEVDASLKLPYSDDFFTAVRSMFNQRSVVPEYRRITFCLIGVASPGELIQERRTTPFNIGQTIELRDFDPMRDDLAPLYAAMSRDGRPGEQLVHAVFERTGGHPFLTTALCSHALAKGARTPEEITKLIDEVSATNSNAQIASHLASIDMFLSTRLHDEGKTLRLYRAILRGVRVHERIITAQLELRLSGLVKRDPDACLVPRNPFYVRRFGLRWVDRTRPMRTQRRLLRVVAALTILSVAAISTAVYIARVSPKHAVVPKQALDDLAAATDADVAADKLRGICTVVLGGATITDQQLAIARKHVRGLLDASADLLERKAADQKQLGNTDNMLILGAKAAVRRGSIQPQLRDMLGSTSMRYLVTTLRGTSGVVNSVRWLGFGRVVTVGKDDSIRIFDVDKRAQIYTPRVTEGLSPALAVCPDGSCVLTAVLPATGYLWDSELTKLSTFGVGDGSADIWSLAIDPGAAKSALGVPGRVSVGDGAGRAWVGTLAVSEPKGSRGTFNADAPFVHSKVDASGTDFYPVYSVQFASNKLVTGALDGVRIVDLASRKITKLKIDASDDIYDARQSPDGSRIAVATKNQVIVVNAAGDHFRTYANAKLFRTVAFTNDGKQVVIAAMTEANQGRIVVMRIQDGAAVVIDTPAVSDAEVSPQPGVLRIASAHEDGTVRIWQLDSEPPDDNVNTLYASWQRKLGLTVKDDQVVPLSSSGPEQLVPYEDGCPINGTNARSPHTTE